MIVKQPGFPSDASVQRLKNVGAALGDEVIDAAYESSSRRICPRIVDARDDFISAA
jgi:hypothetical protein